MKHRHWAFLLAGALLVMLASCTATTPAEEPPPEPEPVPDAQRLAGTWLADYPWDGTRRLHSALTFTETRYIEHHRLLNPDGSVDRFWTQEGTWEVGEESLIRKRWRRGAIDTRERDYRFQGDDLLLQDLNGIYETDPFLLYERAGDDVSDIDIVGTWSRVDEGTDDGNPYRTEMLMTVNADGTLVFMEHSESIGEGGEQVVWDRTITADWTLDEGNLFLDLTNGAGSTVYRNRPDEPRDYDRPIERIAYAPTGVADKIVISPFWREGLETQPFGHYWLVLDRQS